MIIGSTDHIDRGLRRYKRTCRPLGVRISENVRRKEQIELLPIEMSANKGIQFLFILTMEILKFVQCGKCLDIEPIGR